MPSSATSSRWRRRPTVSSSSTSARPPKAIAPSPRSSALPRTSRTCRGSATTNQRLADPRTLPQEDARTLAATHKVVVAIGASIHASEIGGTQAANELLHSLATTDDPGLLGVLQNVVVILIPSLNPDGHRLVVDWYQKQKGTPFEGGPMPWLYHKYAGHDLNRDAFMMNMAENRNLARFFYTQWHPQVFLTMHQMGANGPRFFVPPNVDPIDPNYDPLLWRTAGLLGSAMALELQRDGKSGVVSNAMYDYYWPGYEDSAPLGHNVVCLLTEVAAVKVATPVTVAPADLARRRQGAGGLSAADQFSRSLAGRRLDASPHRRVRPHRGPRAVERGVRVPRADRAELLRDGTARRRGRAARRAVRVPDSARAARRAGDGETRGAADPGRRRSASCARAISCRRRAVSRGHRHRLDVAAVPRVCQDAARTAAVSGQAAARPAAHPNGPTTWRVGRFPIKWASAS